MSGNFTESVVEEAALAWLESIGWQIARGAEIGTVKFGYALMPWTPLDPGERTTA